MLGHYRNTPRTINPQNIQITIQYVFNNYMNKLIEFSESFYTPLFCPSLLENLLQKHQDFEDSDTDSKITRQNNPH